MPSRAACRCLRWLFKMPAHSMLLLKPPLAAGHLAAAGAYAPGYFLGSSTTKRPFLPAFFSSTCRVQKLRLSDNGMGACPQSGGYIAAQPLPTAAAPPASHLVLAVANVDLRLAAGGGGSLGLRGLRLSHLHRCRQGQVGVRALGCRLNAALSFVPAAAVWAACQLPSCPCMSLDSWETPGAGLVADPASRLWRPQSLVRRW